MDILPRIGRSERRELLQMARRSDDLSTALRFMIVARLGLRKTSCEVESELGVARATVVRTAHRYAEQGIAGLYDKRRDNGTPKVDDDFRHRVVVLLRRTPEDLGWRRPPWTREPLCLQMTGEGWPPIAVTTMGRVLARIGARIGMPKPVVLCPWKRDARVQRLRYEILRHDSFRCRACGRTPAVDGVKLHIDHIHPFSLGGLTERANLRTLCSDCNIGRSNRYIDG